MMTYILIDKRKREGRGNHSVGRLRIKGVELSVMRCPGKVGENSAMFMYIINRWTSFPLFNPLR